MTRWIKSKVVLNMLQRAHEVFRTTLDIHQRPVIAQKLSVASPVVEKVQSPHSKTWRAHYTLDTVRSAQLHGKGTSAQRTSEATSVPNMFQQSGNLKVRDAASRSMWSSERVTHGASSSSRNCLDVSDSSTDATSSASSQHSKVTSLSPPNVDAHGTNTLASFQLTKQIVGFVRVNYFCSG